MKIVVMMFSFMGLALTVVPSFFVLTRQMTWTLHAQLMFIGMVLWFVTTPFWMNKEKEA